MFDKPWRYEAGFSSFREIGCVSIWGNFVLRQEWKPSIHLVSLGGLFKTKNMKNNWRYYSCIDVKKKTVHVIQHKKHLKLQFESTSKLKVLNKLIKFVKSESALTIESY